MLPHDRALARSLRHFAAKLSAAADRVELDQFSPAELKRIRFGVLGLRKLEAIGVARRRIAEIETVQLAEVE